MKLLWFCTNDKNKSWFQAWSEEQAEYSKHADISFWGPGFPHYNAKVSAPEILEHFYGDGKPDWIITGLHYLTELPAFLERIDVPKAAFFEDTYNQLLKRVIPLWTKYKIKLVFHRYQQNMQVFKNQITAKWLWHPWGIDTEVFKPYTKAKKFDISMMGRMNYRFYDRRRNLLQALQGNSLRILHKPHPGCFRPQRGQQKPNTVVGQEYADLLSQSLIGITTGGAPGYSVCKFFEIPAAGSLLLAPMVDDLKELGFVDGENMVAIREDRVGDGAGLILKQVRELLADPERIERIATAGRQLILDRHTWAHRAKTFFDALENYDDLRPVHIKAAINNC